MDKRTRVLRLDKPPKDRSPVGFWFRFDDDHGLGQPCIDAHLDYSMMDTTREW